MAQAIGDPEELERFAYALQRFTDSLNDSVGALDGAFVSLGDTLAGRETLTIRRRVQHARPAPPSVQCERNRTGCPI